MRRDGTRTSMGGHGARWALSHEVPSLRCATRPSVLVGRPYHRHHVGQRRGARSPSRSPSSTSPARPPTSAPWSGARSLTNVVFILFGGVVADLPLHLVLVSSSSLAALSRGAVAALVLTGTATVPPPAGPRCGQRRHQRVRLPSGVGFDPQTVPETCWPGHALNRLGISAAMILSTRPSGGGLVAALQPGVGA